MIRAHRFLQVTEISAEPQNLSFALKLTGFCGIFAELDEWSAISGIHATQSIYHPMEYKVPCFAYHADHVQYYLTFIDLWESPGWRHGASVQGTWNTDKVKCTCSASQSWIWMSYEHTDSSQRPSTLCSYMVFTPLGKFLKVLEFSLTFFKGLKSSGNQVLALESSWICLVSNLTNLYGCSD